MIALIQRVKKASVSVNGELYSKINAGYVILLGIFSEDTKEDVIKISNKISTLRIMSDNVGKMNKSIIDTKGEILLVSQFTLCADPTFGRRPSFLKAAEPSKARQLYELLAKELNKVVETVVTGKFGQNMQVKIINDGPVTIIVGTRK